MIEQLRKLQSEFALAEKRGELRTAVELAGKIEEAKGQYAVICNLTERTWRLDRTYRPYTILGKGPQERYALTVIERRKGFEPTEREGDTVISKVEFDYPAREIAADLVREINGNAGPESNNGVFVCAAFEPSDEELAAARGKLEQHYNAVVQEADQEWDTRHKPEMIPGHARDAARYLGLTRAWMYDVKQEQRVECEYCGSKLPRADAAICATCGAILDPAKAARGGLIAMAPPPQGSGAPEPEMATAAVAPVPAPKRQGKGKS